MVELAGVRRRHEEFGEAVEALRETADQMEEGTTLELWDRLTNAVGFLSHELLPYAAVEEEILYPALAVAAVAADAATPVDVLRAEQLEIRRLTNELDEARRGLRLGEGGAWSKVRSVLYGLHAVARMHFRIQDEVVLPLLEAELDPRSAEQLDDAIRAVAHTAGRSPVYESLT
jgi:hemerythrin-like domain-containing protein